jgi:hypothetical protein
MADLARASGKAIRKLANDSLEKLVAQAVFSARPAPTGRRIPRPLHDTKSCPMQERMANASVWAPFLRITRQMCSSTWRGNPLVSGGLEYLFGVCWRNGQPGVLTSTIGGPRP